jgi:hypothetical protein
MQKEGVGECMGSSVNGLASGADPLMKSVGVVKVAAPLEALQMDDRYRTQRLDLEVFAAVIAG